MTRRPSVGDEVEYEPGRRAILTDIRSGVYVLRRGPAEWPAPDPDALTVTRTRAELREASSCESGARGGSLGRHLAGVRRVRPPLPRR